MREDRTELRLLCRPCLQHNLDQIRPQGLGKKADGEPQSLIVEDLLYLRGGINTKTVLLTVCESVIDDKGKSERIFGRSTAFLQADAGGVISALWKVGDIPTAVLVGKFYDMHLNQGLAAPAALRAAQLWLKSATVNDLFQFGQEVQESSLPRLIRDFQSVGYLLSFPITEMPLPMRNIGGRSYTPAGESAATRIR